MAHLIDIILILLIVLIAFIGSKRGFVLTVFDLFSGIASFVIARLAAPHMAVFVYDNFAKAKVLAFLEEQYSGAQSAMTDAVSSVFDFLPEGIFAYVNKSGILDASTLSQDVLSRITSVAELEAKVAAPVVTAVINIVCFAVIAVIALIVLKIVGRLLSGIISKIKIIGKLNTILGGVAGVFKGVVDVFIVSVVLSIASFASETVAGYAADSFICGIVSDIIGI